MIYQAQVLETSNFLKTGTIRVRVAQYYNKPMTWDLSGNPVVIKEGVEKSSDNKKEYHKDFEAYVFSPIGGGENYGLFFLPQVNTKGLVAFIGNPFYQGGTCFWLGSLFEPEMKDGNATKINFPSDKVNANGGGQDGFTNSTLNMDADLSGSLVMRLKSTSYNKEETDINKQKNALNWEMANTENLVVVNKQKVLVHHSLEYDDKQNEKAFNELKMDTNTVTATISKDIDDTKKKEATISIYKNDQEKNMGFSVSTNDEDTKISNEIVGDKNGMSITATNDKQITDINITGEQLTITSNKNTIIVDKNGIVLNAEKGSVVVVAKEVRLGTNDSYVVTTTYAGYYELPNGMIIKSSDKVFA